MIKGLYPFAEYWSQDGSIWVISDPHFGDSDCKLMDPNWIEPDEQVKRINRLCGKNDTLVCLGDIGDIKYIRKLNAKIKILIKGNHDSGDSCYQRKFTYLEKTCPTQEDICEYRKIICANRFNKNSKTQDTSWRHTRSDGEVIEHLRIQIDNSLFDQVYSGPLFISDRIVLSHAPIDFGDNYDCFFNIHGHEHTLVPKLNHLNVAANIINYYPLNLGEIIKDGKLSSVMNFNKKIIEKAGEKKNEVK